MVVRSSSKKTFVVRRNSTNLILETFLCYVETTRATLASLKRGCSSKTKTLYCIVHFTTCSVASEYFEQNKSQRIN